VILAPVSQSVGLFGGFQVFLERSFLINDVNGGRHENFLGVVLVEDRNVTEFLFLAAAFDSSISDNGEDPEHSKKDTEPTSENKGNSAAFPRTKSHKRKVESSQERILLALEMEATLSMEVVLVMVHGLHLLMMVMGMFRAFTIFLLYIYLVLWLFMVMVRVPMVFVDSNFAVFELRVMVVPQVILNQGHSERMSDGVGDRNGEGERLGLLLQASASTPSSSAIILVICMNMMECWGECRSSIAGLNRRRAQGRSLGGDKDNAQRAGVDLEEASTSKDKQSRKFHMALFY